MRPLSPCTERDCHELTTGGRCDRCRREARRASDHQRPNATDRGYDRKWARTRGAYLYRHSTCEEPGCDAAAEEVDHIDGLGPNGPLGHTWKNLRALCKPCHSRRTGRDQRAGSAAWRKPAARPLTIDEVNAQLDAIAAAAPVIAIVGPAGSGKTSLARRLVARGWHHLSIDTVRADGGDWPEFLARLATVTTPTVTESVALPTRYRDQLRAQGALLVAAHCAEPVRRRRVRDRHPQLKGAPRWDDRERADVVIDTTYEVDDDQLDALAARATQASS